MLQKVGVGNKKILPLSFDNLNYAINLMIFSI